MDTAKQAKALHRVLSSSVQRSDFSNALRGEMRVAGKIVFSTTLTQTIPHVVLLRTKKQVIRTNARAIIATVKHLKAIRNWAVVNLPRKAMCSHCFWNLICSDLKVAISAYVASGGVPFPAFTLWPKTGCFINLCPESCLTAPVTPRIKAFAITKLARTFPCVTRVSKTWRTAVSAVYLNRLLQTWFRAGGTVLDSHDLNLLKRWFRLWSGSFGVSSVVRAVCILAQRAHYEELQRGEKGYHDV